MSTTPASSPWRATAMIPSWRPTFVARHYAVTTGHYLASMAASRILERGGNAVDAGVTASMALAVLQPDIVGFAGVAPTLIYLAKQQRVVSLAGLGYWPASTKIDQLVLAGGNSVPRGLLRTVLPAAPATHIEALRQFGTISFGEAASAAREFAQDGFGVFHHAPCLLKGRIRFHVVDRDRGPIEKFGLFGSSGRCPGRSENERHKGKRGAQQ